MSESSANTNVSGSEPRVIRVEGKELPLSCPMPGQELWSMHPKVYLPINKERRVTCPYCGAMYELVD